MSKYNFELDLKTENPVKMIVDSISPNSKILEFGPAHGRLTKYLSEQLACDVDIVELDEESGEEASKYANKSLIGPHFGNIDNFEWLKELNGNKYDFIIFADVLEHLRDPKTVLKSCKLLLNDNGSILLSVPNLAHNSILLNLYNNKFDYNNIGLLDNTHIHFFSYYSLKRMVVESEFVAIKEKATYARVGEIEVEGTYDDVPTEYAKALFKRPLGNLYSFVFELKKRENVYSNDYNIIEAVNMDEFTRYVLTCYVKTETKPANEENKVQMFINPENDEFYIDLDSYGKISALKIHPMNSNCVIEVSAILKDSNILNYELNSTGFRINNNVYILKKDNYIDVKFKELIECKTVVLRMKVLAYDSEIIDNLYGIFAKINEEEIERRSTFESMRNVIVEKDSYIADLGVVISEKDSYIANLGENIKDKEDYIITLGNNIQEQNTHILSLNNEIAEKNKKIEEMKEIIEEKIILEEKQGYKIVDLERTYSLLEEELLTIKKSFCFKTMKKIKLIK